jgi:phosphate transport system permease protein
VTALIVDGEGRNVYGGTAGGRLLWWRLGEGTPGAPQVVSAGGSAVTALSLLNGHRSLVVGQQDGSISVWFPVRREGQDFRLTRIRDFAPQGGPICSLTPSPRDKGFVALDAAGGLGLYYSTSHRTLWTGRAPVEGPVAVIYAPKADAVFVSGPGQLAQLAVDNPHPEITLEALFSKVWYEGYEEPRYTWQSSSGTDDFEPKLSLAPLLAGTLKGTFYSLILAIPLAVFGAMYTSQFMHHSLKRFVKPAVEIMAALPSVVLGFIAGLWLAPHLDQAFPGLLLLIVILPATALLTGAAWRSLPAGARGRFPAGTEVLAGIVSLACGAWLAFRLGPLLENWVFAGRFQTWLLEATGLAYDQRNAVVVGLAMGFAVIPIIFSVAEEAFSNVPRSLVAGSLALGASRWQTVTRVVLPTASAGIFSAVMIGFGRAVGETMIVLMATGNTPVLDWNIFTGMRTLSANIAVEIPEAPAGGTLYRILFLAGLLLFALTFAVNTVAEMVRQNLRRKYANL